MPLLDILPNKVKSVRRMRELLTTKFPPGTFLVKIAITFTKFVELQPIEEFYTPFASPRQFVLLMGEVLKRQQREILHQARRGLGCLAAVDCARRASNKGGSSNDKKRLIHLQYQSSFDDE